MIPVSFRGLALNADGLRAAFDRSWQRPSATPIGVRRQGKRPIVSGVELGLWTLPDLGILIEGDDEEELRYAILAAFDTHAGPGALIVTDDEGGDERYMYVVCQSCEQRAGQFGVGFVATLIAADDVYWRSVTPKTASVTMSSNLRALNVTNAGDVDAYPTIEVNPSVSISGSSFWRYRRFVPIKWHGDGARGWPIELTGGAGLNTSALVSGGKAAASNSLSVIVDGRHVDHWYGNSDGAAGGFNTTSTKIWANMDFAGSVAVALGDGVGTSNTEITAGGDISAFPPQGILQINSEVITYTGRDLYRNTFTGCGRGAYGSTAATQSSGTIYWIQHEVWIVYSSGWSRTLAGGTNRPVIDLTNSSNAVWKWADFGSLSATRTAQWTRMNGGTGEVFTGNQHGAETSPFQVAGVYLPGAGSSLPGNYALWRFHSPAGIDALVWDGSSRYEFGYIRLQVSADGSNWTQTGSAWDSATDGTWDTYSDSVSSLDATLRHVQIVPWNSGSGPADVEAQVANLELTFQSDLRPVSTLLPEQSNYPLWLTIENTTTGEALVIGAVPGLQQGVESVEADTEGKTAVILPGGRNAYQHVGRDGLRPDWLRLAPGVNALQLLEAPSAGNVIEFTFTERWYV